MSSESSSSRSDGPHTAAKGPHTAAAQRRLEAPGNPPVNPRGRGANTAQRALDVAERLVQTRGFNGFSYADVARELGITKASLHYHFPGKAELGEALISRYTERFVGALDSIDEEIVDAREKLDAYAGIYSGVLQRGRMCLCGILAAEYETLPQAMRDTVTSFFDANRAWLTDVITQGRTDGVLAVTVPAGEASQMLLSGLEGAMLIARAGGGVARFESSARLLVGTLAA
jgi:TetR/AcrR family transcriptional repressor of nem operon